MGTDRLPVEMTSYAEDCGMNCVEAMSPRRLLLVNAGAVRAFVLLCEATEEPQEARPLASGEPGGAVLLLRLFTTDSLWLGVALPLLVVQLG